MRYGPALPTVILLFFIATPEAASVTSILTTVGFVPGHWVIVEDACKYSAAFAMLTDAKSTNSVETIFFMIESLPIRKTGRPMYFSRYRQSHQGTKPQTTHGGMITQINQCPSGLVCPWIPSPGRKTSLRSRPGNAGAMVSYVAEWTPWNHVRTLREPRGVRSAGREFAFWVGAGVATCPCEVSGS